MRTVARFTGLALLRIYVGLSILLIAFAYSGNSIGPLKAGLRTDSPGLYLLGLGLLLALPVVGVWLTHGRPGSYLRHKLSLGALGWTTLVIGGLFFCVAIAVPITDFRASLITLLVGLGLLVIGEPERG